MPAASDLNARKTHIPQLSPKISDMVLRYMGTAEDARALKAML